MRFHHSNCFQKGIISHIHVETPYLLRITVLLAYWHNLLLNDLELIYGRNTRLFWRDEFRLSSFEQVPRMGTLALLYPNASATIFRLSVLTVRKTDIQKVRKNILTPFYFLREI